MEAVDAVLRAWVGVSELCHRGTALRRLAWFLWTPVREGVVAVFYGFF